MKKRVKKGSGAGAARQANNGWRTCSRGHKFRGTGGCPVCWPGKAKKR